jgi:hypothetical protein
MTKRLALEEGVFAGNEQRRSVATALKLQKKWNRSDRCHHLRQSDRHLSSDLFD